MEIKDLKNLYIAHRGIQNGRTVENSISSFKLAIKKNVPIEFDTHILNDDNIVVFHDDNLKRLMGLDKKITDYSYDELKKIKYLDDFESIPLLSDVLKLVNGKVLLIIEIKKSDIVSCDYYCQKLVEILDDYKGDFVIKSFDVRVVRWFLKNTNYITGLLVPDYIKIDIGRTNKFLLKSGIAFKVIKPDFISVDYHIASRKVIQKYRKNKPVMLWTIKSLSVLEKVKKYGDSYLIQECYFD